MQLTEDQAEFAGAIAAVAAAEMPIDRLRTAAETGADDAFWLQLKEAGLFSVLLPEDLDGLGFGIHDAIGIFYELGRNPVPGPVLDNAVAAPLVRAAAVDPSFLDDTTVVGVADPAATGRPEALHFAGGKLTGRVELVAASPDVTAFLALADGRAFLVPRTATGVTVDQPAALDYTTMVAGVAFDVAADDLVVVELKDGEADLQRVRAGLRLAMAAQVAGAGQALLDMSVAYAHQRSQFGRTIGSFQAVQHMLAESYEYGSGLESLIEWAAADLPEATAEATIEMGLKTKEAASRFGRLMAENALQVHGGIGFTEEHDLGVFYKLILALEARYGDSRTLATELGRRILQPVAG